MNARKDIIFYALLSFFSALSCSDKTALVNDSKNNHRSELLFFNVLEPSAAKGDLKSIKPWDAAKNNSHIFVHPLNKNSLKQFTDLGFIGHDIAEDEFKRAWPRIIAKNKNTKRLLIFIETHGDGVSIAGKGNFCYAHKYSCLFDENKLLEAVKALSDMKDSRLEDVLILPLSCYNAPVMDRFEEKAKKLKWSFNLSVLSQEIENYCVPGSFGHGLLAKKFMIPHQKISNELLTKFFSPGLIYLHDLLDIINPNLVYSSGEQHKLYKIRSVTKPEKNISLKDFALSNLKLEFPAFICEKFSWDQPVEALLRSIGIESQAHRLSEMAFHFNNPKRQDYNIKINGDRNKILNKPEYDEVNDLCQVAMIFSKDGH